MLGAIALAAGVRALTALTLALSLALSLSLALALTARAAALQSQQSRPALALALPLTLALSLALALTLAGLHSARLHSAAGALREPLQALALLLAALPVLLAHALTKLFELLTFFGYFP